MTTTDAALLLIAWAAAASSVAVTVTRSGIARPLRQYVARRWPGSKLAELLTCHWCFGHWTAAAFLPCWIHLGPQGLGVFGHLVAYFAATWVAGLMSATVVAVSLAHPPMPGK